MLVNKLCEKILRRVESNSGYLQAKEIVKILHAKNHEAYLIGGCVRNLLMGRIPDDFDIATSATPKQISGIFPKSELVGAKFGVVIVKMETGETEVATFREEGSYNDKRHPDTVAFSTLEKDVSRRDFTVNALYLDPISGGIKDYINGVNDLNQRVLRCVGNPDHRFEEDALRIMRLVRFAAEYNFRIDAETWESAIRHVRGINEISIERIAGELKIGLEGQAPDRYFLLLYELGVLSLISEAFEAMKHCEQPYFYHPEGNVLNHTRLMLHQMKQRSPADIGLSIMFHDIGKPETLTKTDRIRFCNHDIVGAILSAEILRNYKFSNSETENISQRVKKHMKFFGYDNMKGGTRKKFVAQEDILAQLELHRVDILCSNKDFTNHFLVTHDFLNAFNNKHLQLPEPFVTGRDLINLHMSPSPQFKMILDKVYELQLDEEIKCREEAFKFIKEHFLTND